MAQGKNKALQYVIVGVPIVIGLYFVYKAVRSSINKRKEQEQEGEETPTKPPSQTPSQTPSQPPSNSGGNCSSLPLKVGCRGDLVLTLQKEINKGIPSWGSLKKIAEDGVFGQQTKSMVVLQQKLNGLTQDGIVGSKTWKVIFGVDYPNTK